jgi:hypothetical protein
MTDARQFKGGDEYQQQQKTDQFSRYFPIPIIGTEIQTGSFTLP